MAHIVPDGWQEYGEASGAARRETETLALLGRGLPEGYTVYHAVHWTNAARGYSIHADVDFVIVNRAGAMLLVDIKSGFLEETRDGLVKRYSNRSRNVALHSAQTVAEFGARLARRPGCEQVPIGYLLYCPDYHVKNPQTAGIGPERIVDFDRRDRLVPTIRELLPDDPPTREAQQVHRFLREIIELQPDVSALIGQAREIVTRVSGGLAHWARQLEFEPFRLRVTGTAGSGKTQLAQAEFRAALDAGLRPLYVCYNRPLADHFARVAGAREPAAAPDADGLACTFHTLCELRLRDHGQRPGFGQADAFDALVAGAAALPVDERWRFDTVIVDEGQDFPEAWRDQVLALVRAPGRVIWLEDPLQNLYGRSPVDLPGFVRMRASSNFRSPRAVVDMLHEILPPDVRIEARGPFASAELDVIRYDEPAQVLDATKEAITRCLAAGYRRADMAIVSFRGRDNSRLLSTSQLGPHSLKSFSGRYDLLGQAIYSDGEILVESVYRFKGQAAPAIVFTEVDFDELDERAVRKLFVGATRAMMKLVIVASSRAADRLFGRARVPRT